MALPVSVLMSSRTVSVMDRYPSMTYSAWAMQVSGTVRAGASSTALPRMAPAICNSL